MKDECSKPHMLALHAFLKAEEDAGKMIYPSVPDRYRAFWETPFQSVRVVLVGQDPYHGPGQAHGLCFSVMPGTRTPPSLQNIFKERKADLGMEKPDHGFLLQWAARGALMLNSVLTVEAGHAASHQGRGWELFTDRVISELNGRCEGIAFILWGAYAQKKGRIIDRKRHFVLESPHPSPLSASRGFLGSRPFSQINSYFVARGEPPFDWALPKILPHHGGQTDFVGL